MNNYCTNCGRKLEENELMCKTCNAPIIDIPYNYEHKSSRRKKTIRIISLTLISIFVSAEIIYPFTKNVINRITINKLQRTYIEPYLEERYDGLDYSIQYDTSGKCIVSGDCLFDPTGGCDGGTCTPYQYLDEETCKSYYFSINGATEKFTLTLVNNNNQFSVVEGKNIYGLDKENDKYTTNNSGENSYESTTNENSYVRVPVKYPYESNFYEYNSTYSNNRIYLDNNGLTMNFLTGVTYDKSKLYLSGSIANPFYLKGEVNLITEYYDKKYNELGICEDTIDLLGEGYSNIAFSCQISESELKYNAKFEDVVFYKINISSLEIIE